MAVLGRVLISSAERLDLPDFLSIDSYTQGDFKYLMRSFVGDEKPYILRGFDVINPGSTIGTQNISIRVADSVVYYPESAAGPFFHGLEEGNAQAAPLVPELRKNATNYVYLTFTTTDAAKDTRGFWDPDKEAGVGGEFTQDVNTQTVLSITANVSVSAFPEDTVPVAIVTVGANFVTDVTDARDMMFRLGSGGLSPNPLSTYQFRSLPTASFQRSEPNVSMTNALDPNSFQGGDKNIQSLKEWMDVVMTKLLELSGTTYWYEDTSTFNLVNIFKDALASSIKSKGEWQSSSATAGLMTWTEDIVLQSVTDKRNVMVRAGNKTLTDGQVMYIDQTRDTAINTGSVSVDWINAINYVNGTLGSFESLTKGDWVKKADDDDYRYLRVEEFYAAAALGGGVSSAANALSIKLSETYGGATETEQGVYTKGVYLTGDVQVGAREDAALTTAGGDLYWLAMRSDTAMTVSDITTTTLTIGIADHDGTQAKCTMVTHGLVDKQQITIAGSTNFDGTYSVEVVDADNFFIQISGGPHADEAAQSAFYATVTTAVTNTADGLQLESAVHGFDTDQKVVIAGTTNYNGSFNLFSSGVSTFTIPVGSGIANESAGTATSVNVYVRTDLGPTKVSQGENKPIGEVESANIMSFIGMDNQSQTFPIYSISPSYNALYGQQNFNTDASDNVTDRLSKLTSMMADKAQDTTISENVLYDQAINTTNGAAQDITFTGTGTMTVTLPSSGANGTVTMSGTLSLTANQCAYYTIDRNATFSVANLGALTVANIIDVPVSENIRMFAYRLGTTDVYLWDGRHVDVGMLPSPRYGALIERQDRNSKMISGGTWSWNSGTSNLAFTADAYIQIPELANVRNTIQQSVQSPISIADGEVAYVDVNRETGAANNLTVTTVAVASFVPTDERLVIARRVGTELILGTGTDKLINGQSKALDAGSSIETRTFIGATDEADSAPAYASETIVTDGESLTTAISNLDAGVASSTSRSNQDRNAKMVSGGTWSWNSGTSNLAFTADAYLQIPDISDARNTIQQSVQSPINIAAGEVAYVDVNRADGGATNLTVTTVAVASFVEGNDRIVIARRVGAEVIVGTGSDKLINGQSKALDAGSSIETRTYIGATDEADSTPSYASDIRGVAAESLTARLGALTGAMGDSQEDRSAYFRSDAPVTWTGTQIEFTDDIVLEIINTKTGTLTAHTILAAGSPVALANNESAYIEIDRTTSANVSIVKSGTVAIPAQTESDKDVFVFGRRKDTAGAVAYLHLPLHKQVLNTGQSVQLGASGGGDGGVTADTYFFRNADNEVDLTAWTTGTNATLSNAAFATPGTMIGTYVKETTNHLSGDESYALKSTTANDFVVSETITLQKRSQAKTNVVKCEFTYGGADDDIQPFMWDVTNDVLLTTSLDLIKGQAGSTTFTMQAWVNDTVDDIRIGFHVLVTNTADLIFDDLSVSDDPFVFKDLFDSQYIHQHTSNGLGSTDNKIGRMTTTAVNSGANLISIADTAAEGTTYTAVRDCTVIVAISHNANAASRFGLSLNSNQLTTAIETITAGHRIALTHAQNGTNGTQSTSAAIKMAKDDVLRRHSDGTADGTAARSSITITAVAGTEHIVSAAKSNMSNPVDYTPTITGFGTPTGVNFEWSRLGKFLIVDGKLTVGTSTAVEAQITLPSGLTIALPHSTTQVIGNGARSTTSAEYDLVLGTDGDTFVNFGRQDASGGGLSAVNGNTWSSGDLSFHFMVPIAEWSSDVTLLAGIPVQKVAYVKDVKSDGTQGGTFTTGAVRTRDLNDVSGDSEIVSNSSNQFTLGAGKYAIEWSAPANNVGDHQSHLRNTTDSTNDIIGSIITMNGGEINSISSFGYGTITITSSKTFEIQHECDITGTTTGFGGAGSFGTGEVYTQVKITKLI